MKYTALISDMLKIFPDLSPEEQAQQIDSYLTFSGYRILAPGAMDREALEAAAKVAGRIPEISAAIRALGGGEG